MGGIFEHISASTSGTSHSSREYYAMCSSSSGLRLIQLAYAGSDSSSPTQSPSPSPKFVALLFMRHLLMMQYLPLHEQGFMQQTELSSKSFVRLYIKRKNFYAFWEHLFKIRYH